MDYIAKKAEERARKPFRSPKTDFPDSLKQDQLDYDKYREIHFRHDHVTLLRESKLNPVYAGILARMNSKGEDVRKLGERLLALGPDALTNGEKLQILANEDIMCEQP